jgi:hypothetical protein
MRYDIWMRVNPLASALVFCAALAIAFSWPLLTRLSATGVWDWSEAAATYEGARHTVLNYGQFPLWNPYLCGGYPSIGNPQTYWVSPIFLFVLLFGSVVGPKLAVVPYIAFGGFGMWLLARRAGVPHPAALVAAPIYLTSGFMGIHLSGGQFLWLSLVWVPWIFYGYIRARESFWWLTAGAAALALIGLSGRSNVVAYVVVMLAALGFIEDLVAWRQRERRGHLRRALMLLIVAFGLGAWKFIPDLYFMTQQDHRLPEVLSISTLWMLGQFFARDISVHTAYEEVSLVEYGYYTGFIPFLLAGWGLLSGTVRRQAVPWLFAGIVMLSVALAGSHNILELLPVFDELRNPQRAMSMVLLVLGLLAAWGLARFPRRVQWLVAGLVIIDLLTLTTPLLAREFSKEADRESGDNTQEFSPQLIQDEGLNPFPVVATNRGAKGFCPAVVSAWRLQTGVVPYLDEYYRGEAYLEGPGTVQLLSHTPNYLKLQVDSPAGTRLVINQNAAAGWRSTTGLVTSTSDGLLAVDLPPGAHTLKLSFFPPGLVLGILATLLTALFLLWTLYRTYASARTT